MKHGVMKKNISKVVCMTLILSVMLTACEIPGVTTTFEGSDYQKKDDKEYQSDNDADNATNQNVNDENDKDNDNQNVNGENNKDNDNQNVNGENNKGNASQNKNAKSNEITDNIDRTHYEIRYIPKDKTIYHIGDIVSPIGAIESSTGVYVHFRIKSAKVYEHVSDAKPDNSKISDEWVLFDGESGYKTMAYKNEETMKSRFLVCDIDMEYEKRYLEWIDFDNITKLSLIYVQEDGSYVMTGYPIYLSNRDSSKPVYQQNEYDIQEGTINLQVGWVIDREVFAVERFDLSKLYICTAHDGNQKFQEFVYLGLKENED